MTYTTHSPEETEKLGEAIAQWLSGGEVLALFGGMGMGKTTITHGIAMGMGLRDDVSSPTFALVNEYSGDGALTLYHFDMYRISGADELESIGFYDYLSDGCAAVIEWSENIADELPPDAIIIQIEKTGENDRKITISGGDRFDGIGN